MTAGNTPQPSSTTASVREASAESTEPIEVVARFAADQPGWTERVFERHTARDHGDCADCGTYRPVSWPCVLVHIAHRAEEILREPCVVPELAGPSANHRGVYAAVCGHTVLTCSMYSPAGPRCPDCLDRLAPPRKRRPWWRASW